MITEREIALKEDIGFNIAVLKDAWMNLFGIDSGHKRAYLKKMFPVDAKWSVTLHRYLDEYRATQAEREEAYNICKWADLRGNFSREDYLRLAAVCPGLVAAYSKYNPSLHFPITVENFWESVGL